MAHFINRQEEVLQIQLTPYGKHLFSQGKFNPEYYGFYDDDILYDGYYGGVTETQNDIVDRIKSTERMEIFTDFSGSVRNNRTNSNITKDSFSRLTDANGKFFRCIGNNSPWSDYAPAWQVTTLGESSLFNNDGGNFVDYTSENSIPIINANIDVEFEQGSEELIYDGEVAPVILYDATHEDKLVLDIQELNTIFKVGGNYDIEIFKISREVNGSVNTRALEFISTDSPNYDTLTRQVADPYVMSYLQTDENLDNMFPVLNPEYVEYYLSVRVDDEISDIPDFRNGLYSTGRPNEPQEPCD